MSDDCNEFSWSMARSLCLAVAKLRFADLGSQCSECPHSAHSVEKLRRAKLTLEIRNTVLTLGRLANVV